MAVLPGLGVDDYGFVTVHRDEVRLAGQGGGPAPEPEGVLVFGVDRVAPSLMALPFPVHQRRVVQHPLGLVEVGRGLCPVLVVGPEPSRPLAVGLSCQELGEPGRPDVGVFTGMGHRRRSFEDDWGEGPSLESNGGAPGTVKARMSARES